MNEKGDKSSLDIAITRLKSSTPPKNATAIFVEEGEHTFLFSTIMLLNAKGSKEAGNLGMVSFNGSIWHIYEWQQQMS